MSFSSDSSGCPPFLRDRVLFSPVIGSSFPSGLGPLFPRDMVLFSPGIVSFFPSGLGPLFPRDWVLFFLGIETPSNSPCRGRMVSSVAVLSIPLLQEGLGEVLKPPSLQASKPPDPQILLRPLAT